jgi:carboxyvinyl-carboxyphosphonate phosphorylmutase
MHWTDRRERFRGYLAGDRCYHPGSVFDAISARCAEDIGFEAGMFAGSVGSLSVLGSPDDIVLTLSEFAGQAYRINRAGNLPLIVDADHGYGNALNVKRTVEELESAGVAMLTIEDTELPKAFGTVGTTRLISLEEGVGKMKAALEGRQDKSLVVAGRTSAVSVNGVDDAIARAQAYEKAGVDAMFFAGIKTRDELEKISASIKIPIMLGSTPDEIRDLDYLGTQRVRFALQGHKPIMAAIKAAYDTLKALREGANPSDLAGASKDLLNQVTRGDDFKRWKKDYLS